MREYGKVHTMFWSSPTVQAMTEDGRLLALYLLTSPHTTIAGVFRLPDGYASEDLSWTQERIVRAFAELEARGFARRCEATRWVWIEKHLKWNPPENPNQRKAATKVALSVPETCAWRPEFLLQSATRLGLGESLGKGLANPSETVFEPLAKAFANQKQKQEQEQKQEAPPPPTLSVVGALPLDVPDPSSATRARRSRGPTKVAIPENFAISDRVRNWATSKRYTRLEERFEQFVSKARAGAYTYADWDDAFMEAIRKDWAGLNGSRESAPGDSKRAAL